MLSIKKAVSLVIFTCFVFPPLAAADEVVRAKVGIEIIKGGIRDSGRKAGAMNNILSPNESLMVHVTPVTNDAFVYIVNSNKNSAELLNPNGEQMKRLVLL